MIKREELITQYNINEYTAEVMIESYIKLIGSKHGDYTIKDINYLGNGDKEFVFECDKCGCIERKIIGSARLRDARKNCKNCKEKAKHEKLEAEKIAKNKKALKKQQEVEAEKANRNEMRENNRVKHQKAYEYNQSLIGTKINRLTILAISTIDGHRYAKCKCECGNIKDIQWHSVKTGVIKSCGCLHKELSRKNPYAKSKTPLYKVWNGMKQRCNNPNGKSANRYHDRGIRVCDEWQDSFEAFEKWSFDNGYRPNLGLSIDRIDNDKGYSPDNCRWVNDFIQSVNKSTPAHLQNLKRAGKTITINGVTKNRKQWLEEYGLHDATVRYREKTMGMTFEEALVAEKLTVGNHKARLNLPYAQQEDIDNLYKISSYIEANFYLEFSKLKSGYELVSQYRIGNYKADFWVKNTNIVVECDGYDYHKTKAQITNDCKRQRDLTLMGYQVIRFSGSEINNDCALCVKQLLEIIKCQEQQVMQRKIQ